MPLRIPGTSNGNNFHAQYLQKINESWRFVLLTRSFPKYHERGWSLLDGSLRCFQQSLSIYSFWLLSHQPSGWDREIGSKIVLHNFLSSEEMGFIFKISSLAVSLIDPLQLTWDPPAPRGRKHSWKLALPALLLNPVWGYLLYTGSAMKREHRIQANTQYSEGLNNEKAHSRWTVINNRRNRGHKTGIKMGQKNNCIREKWSWVIKSIRKVPGPREVKKLTINTELSWAW
jgi:hypothetical protein